jgi:hypothetical protein
VWVAKNDERILGDDERKVLDEVVVEAVFYL